MNVNQVSIRGTTRTPLDRQAWGDSTLKGDTLYLHVFHWPDDRKLVVGGLQSDVQAAYLLSDPKRQPLKVTRVNATDLSLQLPEKAPDSADSVIVVESKVPVKAVLGRVLQPEFGRNILLGFDAATQGKGFSYGDGKTARYYVDGLEKQGNALSWNVRAERSTQFSVDVHYSTPKTSLTPGAHFVVRFGSQILTAPITATAGEREVGTLSLGKIGVAQGAPQRLEITIEGATTPIHFFEVGLTPASPQ